MAGRKVKLTDDEEKFLSAHMRREGGKVGSKEQALAIGYSKIRERRKKGSEKKR